MKRFATYANVMATVAVFVALGGSSYAAVKLTGKDIRDASLTGTDVKDGSLGGADIRAGSIRSGDIANGSLRARDFQSGALPAGGETFFWSNVSPGQDVFAKTSSLGGRTPVFFVCGSGTGPTLEIGWTGVTATQAMTWWYDGSYGVTPSSGGNVTQRFPIPTGDSEHTFRGSLGGDTLVVRFDAHVASTCTFGATVEGTNDTNAG